MQLEPSQLEVVDDLDRSFLELEEADLSKLHNVAIRIIEAVSVIQEWDLEAQEPERWQEDFLALKTLVTHNIWDQEELET